MQIKARQTKNIHVSLAATSILVLLGGILVVPYSNAFAASNNSTDSEKQEKQPLQLIDQQKSQLEKYKSQQMKLIDQQKALAAKLKNKQDKKTQLQLLEEQKKQLETQINQQMKSLDAQKKQIEQSLHNEDKRESHQKGLKDDKDGDKDSKRCKNPHADKYNKHCGGI